MLRELLKNLVDDVMHGVESEEAREQQEDTPGRADDAGGGGMRLPSLLWICSDGATLALHDYTVHVVPGPKPCYGTKREFRRGADAEQVPWALGRAPQLPSYSILDMYINALSTGRIIST